MTRAVNDNHILKNNNENSYNNNNKCYNHDNNNDCKKAKKIKKFRVVTMLISHI
jgi:hypothetical protein